VAFLVAGAASPAPDVAAPGPHLTALSAVLRIAGPAEQAIRTAVSNAWIAGSYDAARTAASTTANPVVTPDGEVFRGAHVIEGGSRSEARGILTTKREIKELRERADAERTSVERLRDELASLDVTVAGLESGILSLQAETHRQEKGLLGSELQLANVGDTLDRVNRKREQIATERRSAEEELRTQEARQDEARESIARIEAEQRTA